MKSFSICFEFLLPLKSLDSSLLIVIWTLFCTANITVYQHYYLLLLLLVHSGYLFMKLSGCDIYLCIYIYIDTKKLYGNITIEVPLKNFKWKLNSHRGVFHSIFHKMCISFFVFSCLYIVVAHGLEIWKLWTWKCTTTLTIIIDVLFLSLNFF